MSQYVQVYTGTYIFTPVCHCMYYAGISISKYVQVYTDKYIFMYHSMYYVGISMSKYVQVYTDIYILCLGMYWKLIV